MSRGPRVNADVFIAGSDSLRTSVGRRLGQDRAIDLPRLLIGVGRCGLLAVADQFHFLLPADVDRVKAPLSALFAGANRFAAALDEDRVRVGRRENADGGPTRLR